MQVSGYIFREALHLRSDVQAGSDEVGMARQSLSQSDHRVELPPREGCCGIRQDRITDAHCQGAAHLRCEPEMYV